MRRSTAGITAPPEDADIAGLMEELRDNIRRYLGKVMGFAEDGEAEAEIAEGLLQPWAVWEPASSTAPASVPPVVSQDVGADAGQTAPQTGSALVTAPAAEGSAPAIGLDSPFADGDE